MKPAETPPSSLRLRVDEDALTSNWRALDTMSVGAMTGAAVKANAYGLGVDNCVAVLRDAGCEQFFVAHWSEVAAVAEYIEPESIAVLHGPITGEEADYARSSGAIPVVNSLQQAKLWLESGGRQCDLMVDTGINRLGVTIPDLSEQIVQQLEIRTLMSHLACADEDSPMNAEQLEQFRAASQRVKYRRLSLANSAGIALGSDYAFDLTRPGLALYGGIPRPDMADVIKQVAYPEAAIIQVRNINAGESVGYNAKFTARQPMRTGTVSLGYADGFLRSWGLHGNALTHGDRRLPLLGKVSMDMVVVDLSEAPDLAEGDWLAVPYYLPDAAQQSTLSQYELLTILGQRLR